MYIVYDKMIAKFQFYSISPPPPNMHLVQVHNL